MSRSYTKLLLTLTVSLLALPVCVFGQTKDKKVNSDLLKPYTKCEWNDELKVKDRPVDAPRFEPMPEVEIDPEGEFHAGSGEG